MSPRSAQVFAALLAVVLIVLVGGVIFVLLSRPAPAGPTTSPGSSPTAAAPFTASPLASSPGLSPLTSPTPSPTASATLPATPSPSPTISPSPAPTVSPTSPQRELRIIAMGLDSRDAEGAIERYVTFHVDGQSLVSARLSGVSAGRVRICLWQDTLVEERECRTVRNGRVQVPTFETGQTTWTLTMIGAETGVSPTANLTLSFNANSPSATVDRFRFQGTSIENYNGIVAEVDARDGGELRIDGAFDDGQGGSYLYRLAIERLGENGGPVCCEDQPSGPATSFALTQSVSGGRTYRTTILNPNDLEDLAVFLRATFTWP